jgi:hypothetical protein
MNYIIVFYEFFAGRNRYATRFNHISWKRFSADRLFKSYEVKAIARRH